MLYALFAAPDLSGAGLMVYFAVVYIIWGVTYTMMDIPYWSMISAVTDTPKDRENLFFVKKFTLTDSRVQEIAGILI